jgi:tRNA modification GTPase
LNKLVVPFDLLVLNIGCKTAQREAAIVSSTPGTTRDIIELTLDFHGFPVTIADTAGLRISTEEIESIGVERAKDKAGHSDLKICLLSLPTLFPSSSCSRLTPVIDPLTLAFIDLNTLIVLNKSDLLNYSKEHGKRLVSYLRQEGKEWIGFNDSTSSNSPGQNQGINIISLQESTGLSDLVESLKSILQNRFDLDDDDVADTIMITTARHRRCLEECKNYLDNFLRTSALCSAGTFPPAFRPVLGSLNRVVDHD